MEYDLIKSAKRYIDENRAVKCCICGKDVYSYQPFECAKKGKKRQKIYDCA